MKGTRGAAAKSGSVEFMYWWRYPFQAEAIRHGVARALVAQTLLYAEVENIRLPKTRPESQRTQKIRLSKKLVRAPQCLNDRKSLFQEGFFFMLYYINGRRGRQKRKIRIYPSRFLGVTPSESEVLEFEFNEDGEREGFEETLLKKFRADLNRASAATTQ